MVTGVYKIINNVNGKCYYGSSSDNIISRWKQHKSELNRNVHSNSHLQSAWNKYGEMSFVFEVVLECLPEECLEYEQQYLNKYWDNCVNCYNIYKTAGSPFGSKMREETKQLLSKRMSGEGNPMFGKTGVDSPHYGKKHSNESRLKRSVALSGKKRSKEQIESMRKVMLGRSRSLSSIEKQSKTISGQNNPKAKLTEKDIVQIREKYNTKQYTQQELADEYNVSRSNIGEIVNMRTWK